MKLYTVLDTQYGIESKKDLFYPLQIHIWKQVSITDDDSDYWGGIRDIFNPFATNRFEVKEL